MRPSTPPPLVIAAAAALVLAGCSSVEEPVEQTELTLRLWDEQVATAYDASIAEFEAANPGVDVTVEVVPWDEYFVGLRQDVAAGGGADVFWLNGSYVQDYVDSNLLLPVSEVLGPGVEGAWAPSAVSEYTRDGELWGVPQIVDGGSALYYNADLLSAAGLTPADVASLAWHPTDPAADTLLGALQRLTRDTSGRDATDPAFDAASVASWGFNAAQDTQNVLLNFIGSNGGTYQSDDGRLTFTDPRTVEAFAYLVDLVGEHHVAPPADLTNPDSGATRDLFLEGRIALFESGTYNLANVDAGADFEWGVVPMPSGPAGRVTTSPAVIAAANANTEHPDEVAALLGWLGSADANEHVAEAGAAVPARHGRARRLRRLLGGAGRRRLPLLHGARGRRADAGSDGPELRRGDARLQAAPRRRLPRRGGRRDRAAAGAGRGRRGVLTQPSPPARNGRGPAVSRRAPPVSAGRVRDQRYATMPYTEHDALPVEDSLSSTTPSASI